MAFETNFYYRLKTNRMNVVTFKKQLFRKTSQKREF